MHLSTLEQIVSIIVGAFTIAALGWKWFVLPWLKGLANEIVPAPQKPGEDAPPTMRQLQEEQTAILHKLEEKIGERMTAVEKRVDDHDVKLSDHETRIDGLEGRVTALEQAGK